ncbi:MAG: PCMD domain-containing protein, partial [Duncaniella sp.]|nr:PCMD domain-containing protein [Duncaniella sp.]
LEAAPMVLCDGFTSGQTFTCIESFRPDAPLKATISARSGIESVVLNTTSASLLAQHWPATVDLTAPGIAETILGKLGLKTVGLDAGKDVFAVIDFTDLIPNISYLDGADNTTTFTLVVTDKRGRTLERQLFSYSFEKLTIEMLPESAVTGQGQATLLVHYNGADAKSLRIEAKNPFGIYEELSCLPTLSGDNVYTFNVQGCDLIGYSSTPVVRAKVGNYTSADLSLKIPAVYVSQTNAFATHAYATVLFTDDAASARKSDVTFEASTDGGSSFSAVTATQVESSRSRAAGEQAVYHITGLTHNTPYILRARLDDEISVNSPLTTEEARQLPNGDMEQWYDTDVYTHQLNYGVGKTGMTDIKRWFANSNGETFWATRNALTTAQSSGTTCYYTSFSGTVPVSGVSGNAAEISTLGYGTGSTYDSKNGGGSNKYVRAGMLFIGDHSASDETTETINYGKPWPSRPSGFSFKYKYAPVNGESFRVEIVVEHRENGVTTELGRGTLESSDAQSSFVSSGNVNVDYSNLDLSATHIYIVFISSTLDDKASVHAVTGSKNAMNGFSDSRRVGSVLTVDDIKLNY